MVLETRMDIESRRGIGMRLLAPRLNNRNLIFFGSPVPALASAKAAAGNQPWEEHCSETLLCSSPILQTPADYKLLLLPRLRCFEPPAWQAGLWPAPEKCLRDRMAACRSWIYFPCCKVVCLWCMCFCCCWGVFPILTLYSPRSIVWGLFFFSSPSSCYAVFFFNSLYLHFTTDCTLYDCVCDK